MRYIVIEGFCDKTDEFHPYKPGMEFPREGLEVSEARIKELSTDANALKKPLIKEEEQEEKEEKKINLTKNKKVCSIIGTHPKRVPLGFCHTNVLTTRYEQIRVTPFA